MPLLILHRLHCYKVTWQRLERAELAYFDVYSAFLETSCFPSHILKLREMMKKQEELEQKQKQIDQSVCKVDGVIFTCDFSTYVSYCLLVCRRADQVVLSTSN